MVADVFSERVLRNGGMGVGGGRPIHPSSAADSFSAALDFFGSDSPAAGTSASPSLLISSLTAVPQVAL